MRRVAVIGNGLSISASTAFKTPDLTRSVRAALAPIDGGRLLQRLDAAGQLLGREPGAYRPQDNFEHLLGPLDRLAILLRGPVLGIVGAVAQQQAAMTAAANTIDGLYVRGVGVVLNLVNGIAMNDVPVRTVIDWVLAGLAANDSASVYTPNYDPLIYRWLLDADRDPQRPAIRVDDEFARLGPGSEITVTLPGARPNQLHLVALRPPHMARPHNVHLYHLHGGVHWVEYGGTAWKARDIDDLRNLNVFARWAAGEKLPVRPRVILTDQKTRAVALDPFAQSYDTLHSELAMADRVLIAGYSFGDVPLNDALAIGWHRRPPTSRWLVIDHANPLLRIGRMTRARATLRIGTLAPGPQFSFDGLPQVTNVLPNWWS